VGKTPQGQLIFDLFRRIPGKTSLVPFCPFSCQAVAVPEDVPDGERKKGKPGARMQP
jgi:hypothetical protein